MIARFSIYAFAALMLAVSASGADDDCPDQGARWIPARAVATLTSLPCPGTTLRIKDVEITPPSFNCPSHITYIPPHGESVPKPGYRLHVQRDEEVLVYDYECYAETFIIFVTARTCKRRGVRVTSHIGNWSDIPCTKKPPASSTD